MENVKNDTLKKIHGMVETVKRDSEVSVRYMKEMEREKMLFEQGVAQGLARGREEEQANTEKERKRAEEEKKRAEEEKKRAEEEKKRAEEAEREVVRLRELLQAQGIDAKKDRV